MSSPPVFLRRTRRPSSLVAGLAMAGLMTIGFWGVPGVVLLTWQASEGTVPCQVRRVAPTPHRGERARRDLGLLAATACGRDG